MSEIAWKLFPSREEANVLSRELEIPQEIAQVLVNRNITCAEDAHKFLYGRLKDLNDPYLMEGMRAAVQRVRTAVSRKEKILIFGDYDVDGILSVVVLTKALRSLGADVDYFIPERLKYGYGIKEEFVAIAEEKEASLVMSVDCGIKATKFTNKAKERGIDVIITDHHLPGDVLPKAKAILNPNLVDTMYPDKGLAGIGVVFKLVQALFKYEGDSTSLTDYLKLVSIATIADVAELRGENRLLVKFGLEALDDVSNIGLLSLMDLCGLRGRKVSVGDIGFRIGPRINAAGRMGATDLAVRLFFTDSFEESMELASHLDRLNSKRQKVQEKTYSQAVNRIKGRSLDRRYKFLVLGCEEWHRGVIGIVASKLKDFFHRPVLLFTYEDGKACGSGRSIDEFPIIDCLDACQDLFLDYGGHSMAVGCVLPQENMSHFKRSVNDFANSRLSDDDLKRKITIDSKVNFMDIESHFLEIYDLLSPFGVGNPKPIFLTEKVEVMAEPQMIKGKHSKFFLKQNGRVFEALGWERADWARIIQRGEQIDIVYSFQFSDYLGERSIILSIEDIRK